MDYPIHVPKVRFGKREIDIFPFWIVLLLVGLAFGAVGGYQVFRYGLSVTGLNDQVPWGLWIVIDISSIALGGGAFTMGVIVYLLKIKRFENIGRLAVIIGFLGYSTAGMVLLFDLGQPLRFWHPVVFWQPHSLLWEITMCVVLYLTVLVLEMFPSIMEHKLFARFPFLVKIAHFIHKMGPVLAVLGLTLSLLHQASLGATYGVLSGRGLWFRPTAPVMFVLSAVGGGMSLLFVLSVFVFRVMRPGLVKDEVLAQLARIAGAILLLCIYLKLWDWAMTYYYSFDSDVSMQLNLLNSIAPYDWSFWLGQVLIGALIPGFTLITYKPGKNLRLRVVVSLMAAFCVVIMRWNYNFSGLIAAISYDPFTPTIKVGSYVPTWQELAVGLGVISYWLLGFSLAARFLPFYDTHGAEH
ncbi:MAG: polysulfide reductase NrfD [Ardenticatenaceae bacterium]|nr:polysulfide reductase NrfD [Ardenticatenaceae bacterium]